MMHVLGALKQEPLFYTVPAGAMEAYRDSVEAEHARLAEVCFDAFPGCWGSLVEYL